MRRWQQIALWGVTAPVAFWIGWNLDLSKPAPQEKPHYMRYLVHSTDPNVFTLYDPNTGEWQWVKIMTPPRPHPAPEPEDASK